MLFKSNTIFVLLALAMTVPTEAQLRPNRPRPDQDGNSLPSRPAGRNPEGEMIEELFEEQDFVEISCPDVAGEPDCLAGKPGMEAVEGTWVCHTYYSPITGEAQEVSACINPAMAFETDTCGCCNGECPDECSCSCDLPDGSAGVLVTATKRDQVRELCVPSARAVSMIARSGGRVACTECDV